MANLFEFSVFANDINSFSFISGTIQVRIEDNLPNHATTEADVLSAFADGLTGIATALDGLTEIGTVIVGRSETEQTGITLYPPPE